MQNSTILILCFRSLYGVTNTAKPSVIAIDDNLVAYLCGHVVVIYDLNGKETEYVQGMSHQKIAFGAKT